MIKEWESTKAPEVFKGLLAGSYTIKELAAPEGYAVTGSLTFEVSGTEARQEITLANEKIVTEFQKTDVSDGSAVPGAILQLIKAAGTKEEAKS